MATGEVRSVVVPGTVGAVHPTRDPAVLVIADTDGSLHTVLTEPTIGNGMDWSAGRRHPLLLRGQPAAAGRRLRLRRRDRRVDRQAHPRRSRDPDGLTLDAEGGVWVAFYGGGRVCRVAPDGDLDVTIDLPVGKVTSCCFGGPDLSGLFISTSTAGVGPEELRAEPGAGAIFHAVRGHRGRPGTPFAVSRKVGV